VTGGIFADNRCGFDAKYSDNLTLTNIEIRGFSNSARNLTRPLNFWKMCPSTAAVVGYRLNTFIYDASETKGATVKNLVFADFDTSPDCPNSVAIEINSLDVRDAHFDYLSSLQNISIQDSRDFRINACPAQNVGINDIVLIDLDGSVFNRAIGSGPYSIISNVNSLTSFATNGCTLHPDTCIADCSSTCLRTMEFMVEQTGTRHWVLRVTKDNGDGVFYIYVSDRHGLLRNNYIVSTEAYAIVKPKSKD
jgi:hypothetical protein